MLQLFISHPGLQGQLLDFGMLLNKKAARVEVNISLAFLRMDSSPSLTFSSLM